MAVTGTRVGEALGLRREDMHLMARSDALGCQLHGPHVHVRRRVNVNGALAKSRYPRTVPVAEDVVGLYADYQHERSRAGADVSDMVFVNLFRPPVGRPMSYANTKDLFNRLAIQWVSRAGHTCCATPRPNGGSPRRDRRYPAKAAGSRVGVLDGPLPAPDRRGRSAVERAAIPRRTDA